MIKAVNLNKTYFQGKTKIEAVKTASLEIFKKESVLIAGPSGAGKSTLLHLLGGLDKPTRGKLFFSGSDFYALSDKARSEIRNEKIGFVFQFYHLLPEFTILENVMLPALMKKRPRRNARDIKKRSENLLNLVGLGRRIGHRPRELSGGESQRAAIARALINFPEVLLCDEPTGNLDSKIGHEIIDCLWAMKEKENMALVIVTHDEQMQSDFDKRFAMRDGIIGEQKYGTQSLSERQVCRQK
ncbi:MAG: ABC transporter ATP-binding protein [Candidatus Omnitrophica bacterium]|nr:ABC transporter ATP-binding protein [Candidatus Omnitrophota bacterium]